MEKTEGGKPPLSYDKQKHQCLLSERSERPTSPPKEKRADNYYWYNAERSGAYIVNYLH